VTVFNKNMDGRTTYTKIKDLKGNLGEIKLKPKPLRQNLIA